MKLLNFALITASITLLSNCNVDQTQAKTINPCVLLSADTLKLSGSISSDMQDCALKLISPDIKKIIVNSKGGDVDAGRIIGYRIGEMPRTIAVERYCLSSCGNYFIPPANAVELETGAIIGLHGSPDPHMLSSENLAAHLAELEQNESVTTPSVKRQLKRKQDQRDYQLAEEEKFAQAFKVPKGWRHYRDINDEEDGWRRHFEAGSDSGVEPNRFMIVEKAMISSCLPHISVTAFQAGLEDNVFKPKMWAKLKEDIGAYRSYGLKCKS